MDFKACDDNWSREPPPLCVFAGDDAKLLEGLPKNSSVICNINICLSSLQVFVYIFLSFCLEELWSHLDEIVWSIYLHLKYSPIIVIYFCFFT
jgi:hypothetical protein